MKPSIKHIEDCQKLTIRCFCAAFDLGLKPAAGPGCLALVEKCDRKLNFGLEIAVKTSLSATRLGENGIDTDLADPVP